ncbi:MAG: hypothetical protein EOM24_28440, partial [Chloroflexia bacterium]|nr:hypothetical protein [Chloroflexia bacterium]
MTEAAQEALVEADPTVDDQQIEDLVKRGLVSDKQAAELGLVMDLARLTGDNLTFIRNLHASGVKSTLEMIRWKREDWLERIQTVGSLPPDETPETYADHILLNLDRTYPSQLLLSRVTDPQQARRIETLERLQPIFDRYERLIEGRIPATIDWQDIEDAQRQELESHLAEVTAFANTYRHLEFPALINDREISLADKETTIKKRMGLLGTFLKHNESLDLRLVDLVSKSENPMNWQDIPEAEQPMVRRQLMAFQRPLALAPTTAARERLLGAGLDSSVAISHLSQAQFIEASGLSEALGYEIYNKAANIASSISHTVASIRELQFGLVNIGLGNNIRVSPLVNALRDIDGLEALFGSQHGCACEHSSSILGAPAYFVDLMRFIDENITHEVQKHHKSFALHPLNLRRRRSDLLKL